jgi:hypothetical protein
LGISIQVNGARVLYEPSLTRELHFTKEQNTELEEARTAIRDQFRNAFIQFPTMSPEERRDFVNRLIDAGDKSLIGVLSKKQKQQFEKLQGAPIEVDLSPLPWARQGG